MILFSSLMLKMEIQMVILTSTICLVDEETNQGLVTDVCVKRKVRNYIHLLKGLESPYDIFIREGNILNPLIREKREMARGK